MKVDRTALEHIVTMVKVDGRFYSLQTCFTPSINMQLLIAYYFSTELQTNGSL